MFNLLAWGLPFGGALIGGLIGFRRCALGCCAAVVASLAALQLFEVLVLWTDWRWSAVGAAGCWWIGFVALQFGLDQWSLILRFSSLDRWRMNGLLGASCGLAAGALVWLLTVSMLGAGISDVPFAGPANALGELPGIQRIRRAVLDRQGEGPPGETRGRSDESRIVGPGAELLAQLVGDRELVEQYLAARGMIADRLQSWSSLLLGDEAERLSESMTAEPLTDMLQKSAQRPAAFEAEPGPSTKSQEASKDSRSRVVLRNGRTLEGGIVHQSDQEVALRVSGGILMRFRRTDVIRIESI